ncbi:MAG TPA: hypothetical protein VJ741_05405 [Solirubrobacteraceae bacterium]|nr:hypothetical protein [Solirubrobacteraceae bacterium]
MIGGVLAVIATVRRGKPVHPTGVVYDARLLVSGSDEAPRGARLLCERAEHQAVVRFSRALGLPRPVPDLLGVSIRVLEPYGPGRHQDFLLVTSVDRAILHHLFVPAADVQQRPYSSSLAYRAGNERFLIGLLPDERSPRPHGRDEFERLDAAAATGRLVFGLAVADVGGRFRPVAELRIGRRLAGELDALRFNPWNTGRDLEPAGWLNGARYRAYKLSQTGWRQKRADGERRQRAAEHELDRVSGARG